MRVFLPLNFTLGIGRRLFVGTWRVNRRNESDLQWRDRELDLRSGRGCTTTLGKLFTPRLCPWASSVNWYRRKLWHRKAHHTMNWRWLAPYLQSRSVSRLVAEGNGNGDQHRPKEITFFPNLFGSHILHFVHVTSVSIFSRIILKGIVGGERYRDLADNLNFQKRG